MLAAATAVLVALVALPVGFMDRPDTPGGGAVRELEVVAQDGVVRLAWRDGEKETYRVYKSDDPRSFSGADAYTVWGNVWTDQDPGSSQIVYYRIE